MVWNQFVSGMYNKRQCNRTGQELGIDLFIFTSFFFPVLYIMTEKLFIPM